MTAPEPTAEQRQTATLLIRNAWLIASGSSDFHDLLTNDVARALAAAVHAEREKVRALAVKLDALAESYSAEAARDFDRGDQMGGTNLTGQYYATAEAARRIREVAG